MSGQATVRIYLTAQGLIRQAFLESSTSPVFDDTAVNVAQTALRSINDLCVPPSGIFHEIVTFAAHAHPATRPAFPCPIPDRPARVLFAVPASTPPLAQQQGIFGEVTVGIELDDASHLVSATIVTSPAQVLNSAALDATRASFFESPVRNCAYVALKSSRFMVEFSRQ